MYVGKAGVYLSKKPFRCSILGLTPHIRLGSKGLTVINTLAYHETLEITDEKLLKQWALVSDIFLIIWSWPEFLSLAVFLYLLSKLAA